MDHHASTRSIPSELRIKRPSIRFFPPLLLQIKFAFPAELSFFSDTYTPFLNRSTDKMQLMSCCEFAAAHRPSLTRALVTKQRTLPSKTAVRCASRRDDAEFSCGGGGGGLVDEGMVVLRRRIHEMQAAERNWEPPAEWAAWEKEWYGTYDDDICGLVGVLQAFLVSSRPAIGVGLLAVLVLSVPASAFVLVSHLLDASLALISNLQL